MHIHKKSGITLTELLVASVLIGIVMIGVASFGVSIKQLQGSTNKSAIIAMRVRATMPRLIKSAYLATGNQTDEGIWEDGNGANKGLCFRNDENTPPTPDSYADDTWICYFRGGNRDLFLCDQDPVDRPPVGTGNECDFGGGAQLLLELETGAGDYYQIVRDGEGRIDYVEFTLQALYDQQSAYHPIDNPRYTLTTQISPPGHGR